MSTVQPPRRRILHLNVEQVGQETLLYDEQRHQAFCLNPVSAAVWNLCDGNHTLAQIALAASLTLQHPVTEEVVLFALAQLGADGLLEAPTAPISVAPVSRRTMMARTGAGAILMLPVIAAIMAPKAAQAYGGCVDCPADNETPVDLGSPSEPAAPPSDKREITPN